MNRHYRAASASMAGGVLSAAGAIAGFSQHILAATTLVVIGIILIGVSLVISFRSCRKR